jgi:hypothetical protein
VRNEQAQANNDVDGDGKGVGMNIKVVLKQTTLAVPTRYSLSL